MLLLLTNLLSEESRVNSLGLIIDEIPARILMGDIYSRSQLIACYVNNDCLHGLKKCFVFIEWLYMHVVRGGHINLAHNYRTEKTGTESEKTEAENSNS